MIDQWKWNALSSSELLRAAPTGVDKCDSMVGLLLSLYRANDLPQEPSELFKTFKVAQSHSKLFRALQSSSEHFRALKSFPEFSRAPQSSSECLTKDQPAQPKPQKPTMEHKHSPGRQETATGAQWAADAEAKIFHDRPKTEVESGILQNRPTRPDRKR